MTNTLVGPPKWRAVLTFPEAVGRWIMDLGFGSLVDKFEAHFGKWPTRIMLGVIGLTALIACVRLIVLDAILPIFDFLQGAGGQSFLDLTGRTLTSVTVAAVSGLVAAFVFRWFVNRGVNKIVARAEERIALAENLTEIAKDLANETAAAARELSSHRDELSAKDREIDDLKAQQS